MRFDIENLSQFLELLRNRFLTDDYVRLQTGPVSFTLSFAACALLILFAERRLTIRHHDIDKKRAYAILGVAFVSYLLFYVGYFKIFGDSFASFFRYSATILVSALLYVTLRYLSIRIASAPRAALANPRKAALRSIALSLLCLAICTAFLPRWKERKYDGNIYQDAANHANLLTEQIGRDRASRPGDDTAFSNIYLLNAGQRVNDYLFHHRVYFDLIGTRQRIRNFYNETSLAPNASVDPADAAAVKAIAARWCARLIAENYQYVTIAYLDDLTSRVFSCISGSDDALANRVYRIEPADTDYGLRLTLLQ